jgi:hypothetical protein
MLSNVLTRVWLSGDRPSGREDKSQDRRQLFVQIPARQMNREREREIAEREEQEAKITRWTHDTKANLSRIESGMPISSSCSSRQSDPLCRVHRIGRILYLPRSTRSTSPPSDHPLDAHEALVPFESADSHLPQTRTLSSHERRKSFS